MVKILLCLELIVSVDLEQVKNVTSVRSRFFIFPRPHRGPLQPRQYFLLIVFYSRFRLLAMDDDVGTQNQPLSLIVIPPASPADNRAGSTDVPELTDTTFISPSSSRNLSSLSPNTPSSINSVSSLSFPGENPSQTEPVATGDKPHPELVEIQIAKAEDTSSEVNGQIELLEASSDSVTGSSDSVGPNAEDGQDWGLDNSDHEMKRVKVSSTLSHPCRKLAALYLLRAGTFLLFPYRYMNWWDPAGLTKEPRSALVTFLRKAPRHF